MKILRFNKNYFVSVVLFCFYIFRCCFYKVKQVDTFPFTYKSTYYNLSIYLPIMSTLCWGPGHMHIKLKED